MKSDLFKKALEVRKLAYAPYSKFFVGASVLADDGKIYAGCNVENASYPCGSCAEAGAISAMIAGGGKIIKHILIVAETEELIVPCGNCLQKILEFSDENTKVLLADLSGIKEEFFLKDLLPKGFK